MNRQMTISLFAMAVLAACSKGPHENKETEPSTDVAEVGGPSIDFVKGQASRVQGLTLGQVLNNNPNCASRQWSVAKDKYGRDVVTFRCSVKPSNERAARLQRETVEQLQRIAQRQSDDCSVDAAPFVHQRTQQLSAYYARFTSIAEVLEFVVNQGKLVENRAGIFDATGTPLALDSTGISFVSFYLQDTDDGQAELDHLYSIIASGGPQNNDVSCEWLKQAQASAGTASGVPSQGRTDSGLTTDPGDAEPEPKNQ